MSKWRKKCGIGGDFGSLGGNDGETMVNGDGGRGLKWTTLLVDITNGHELITVCQKRQGVIGGRLTSATVERSTSLCGITVDEPDLAQRPSRGRMQRCKVIPLITQNHNILYRFRTSSIEDATNDKHDDRVGENYEDPFITILAQKY
jgi:hypothetical protein